MNLSSLRFKIYLGFGLIAVLLILVGIVSLLGSRATRNAYSKIEKIENLNETVLTIDRDVQEMRMQVDRFVNSGHPSLKKEVRVTQQRVAEGVEAAKNLISDQEGKQELELIQNYVESYADNFDKVVIERQVRQELVYEKLPALYEKVEDQLAQFSEELQGKENLDSNQLRLNIGVVKLAKSKEYFLRYFENPNTRFVNLAVQHLNEVKLSLSEIEELKNSLGELVDQLDELEKTGLRAVQATRSYMFLRNVVMAGDQSELSYDAKKLRASAQKRKSDMSVKVQRQVQRTNWLTGGITLGALFLSLLTSVRLAVLILPPLARLRDTFRQLSFGATLDEVPGEHRNDEIGELAHAASVFSDQNKKTRELLQESEMLAEELENRASELTASNEELDRFAYVASHDLKSPLRGIRQLAQWIHEDAQDDLPPKSREHLAKMNLRVEKMEELLDDLLQYSRVGRIESNSEFVNTYELLLGIVELIDNPCGVEIKIPSTLPAFTTILAPFKQIWLNLIGNAVKHSDKGKKGVVEINWENDGEFYVFSVRDNGPGIDEPNHERAFQMFQRVGNMSVDGSGMGLAMVRKEVQSVGGVVELESELGAGATFKFSWPIELDLVAKN